jgi:hypothetical protein
VEQEGGAAGRGVTRFAHPRGYLPCTGEAPMNPRALFGGARSLPDVSRSLTCFASAGASEPLTNLQIDKARVGVRA